MRSTLNLHTHWPLLIPDMISYYSLPSTVVNNAVHKTIKAAYAFYNVATSMSLQDLMTDALILAKGVMRMTNDPLFSIVAICGDSLAWFDYFSFQDGYDVFNALDLMDNKDFLEPLKFGVGDGNLQYYLYNWKCPSVEPSDIGLVLQ